MPESTVSYNKNPFRKMHKWDFVFDWVATGPSTMRKALRSVCPRSSTSIFAKTVYEMTPISVAMNNVFISEVFEVVFN